MPSPNPGLRHAWIVHEGGGTPQQLERSCVGTRTSAVTEASQTGLLRHTRPPLPATRSQNDAREGPCIVPGGEGATGGNSTTSSY